MSGDGLSTETDGVTVSITKLSMIMEYEGFDTIDSIEIPEEALAAQEADVIGIIE